jgi:hypothetical protein
LKNAIVYYNAGVVAVNLKIVKLAPGYMASALAVNAAILGLAPDQFTPFAD